MKLKAFAISAALLVGVFAANAQEKKVHDLYLGVNAGALTPMVQGAGLSQATPYIGVQLGYNITPVWGVRGYVGGLWMNRNADYYYAVDVTGTVNRKFVETGLDLVLNFSNIFADDLAKFDVYAFAGPSLTVARQGTVFSGTKNGEYLDVVNSSVVKVRPNASAGLGLAYNFSEYFALGLESRFGFVASIFGDADQFRKSLPTTRLSLTGVYTFGGKTGKVAGAAAAAAAAGYLSSEAAEALAAEAVANNPKIVEKVVEKVVEKEVVKEVVKEYPASSAIFFSIGKADISSKDKARVKIMADAIKATDDGVVYEVGGYADKKTGSAKYNQSLSEKRAKAVYDLLVKEGVPAEKLEVKGYGGVDPLFYGNDVLSRTVIIKKK